MKNVIVLAIGILFCSVSLAQICDSVNLGTKTLYTNKSLALTPAPAGYLPVFINHVGRHGSRHLTKNVSASNAYQLLLQADSAGMLTNAGTHLKRLLEKLNLVEQKNVKNISEQGILEQKGIADRMYQQNTMLFRKSNFTCQVQITKEIRTKQTADAFLAELKKISGITNRVDYQVNDTILRFYDLSPAYTRFEEAGNWQDHLKMVKQKWWKKDLAENSLSRFFQKAFLSSIQPAAKEDFVNDLYGFFTILPSIQNEMKEAGIQLTADSIKQFFTCSELAAIGRADRAEDYLLKGPGMNKEGIQVKIAAPLLVDFINTTDHFIQHPAADVQLRFSHAETIAPFAALLGLQGADHAVKDISLFDDKVWDAANVVPLSANIRWILYKSEHGEDYKLKCLLNEKEVRITGLPAKSFPYYSWKEVRRFYIAKLQKLQLRLTDRLYTYLQEVQ